MKTIRILLYLLVLGAVTFAGEITIKPTAEQQAGLQAAADAFNARAKASFDAAQTAKPEKERVAYIAMTAEAYASLRFYEVLDSYAEQASRADLDTLTARLKSATPAKRAAARKAVESALK